MTNVKIHFGYAGYKMMRKVDLDDTYYFGLNSDNWADVTKFVQTSIFNAPHYRFVEDYLKSYVYEDKLHPYTRKRIKRQVRSDFMESTGYNDYIEYWHPPNAENWKNSLQGQWDQFQHGKQKAEKFMKLIDDFDVENYNSSPEHRLLHMRGVIGFDSEVLEQTWVDKRLSKEFCTGPYRFVSTEPKMPYQYDLLRRNEDGSYYDLSIDDEWPPGKMELFFLDGHHRASILAYHGAEDINVMLEPFSLVQIDTSIESNKRRNIEDGFYMV